MSILTEKKNAGNRCQNAVSSGRRYLISCIENDQFYDKWYGNAYPLPVERSSSPLLCFFTALALKESGGIPESVKEYLRSILAKAKKGSSYGYDEAAPIDADDTAFALRTLVAIGDKVTPEMITDALKPFKCGDSWFTFSVSDNLKDKTPLFHYCYTGPASVAGPHPEVYLNILVLMQEAGMPVSRILPVPLSKGLPVSYFYRSSFYGAWLFSSLCRGIQLQYNTIKNAVLSCRNNNGGWSGIENGFSAVQETALAVLTLNLFSQSRDNNNLSITYLLAQQEKKTGLFPGGNLWNHYLPSGQEDAIWYGVDVMSIVSTSCSIRALADFVNEGEMEEG